MTLSLHGQGEGYGKVILLGEHAVVYGYPALSIALDRGANATFDTRKTAKPSTLRLSFAPEASPYRSERLEQALSAIRNHLDCPEGTFQLSLDIPPSRGLGSSAALCVAVTRSILAAQQKTLKITPSLVDQAASKGESIFHGNPSGIDTATSIHGNALLFWEKTKFQPLFAQSSVPFSLLIADTGKRAPTSQLVHHIKSLQKANPQKINALFSEIASLSQKGAQALKNSNLDTLGTLMNRNHEILASLDLSTPTLNQAVKIATKEGAWGAKLTGAGGGGCLIALAPKERKTHIQQCLQKIHCVPVDAELNPKLFVQNTQR